MSSPALVPSGGTSDARASAAPRERELKTAGRTLRAHTARATIVNGLFQVGLASLNLAKGFVVAAFLTREQYGIWGILVVGLGTLSWLKGSAVGQKYVQQSSEDQERAFQTAFTLELILSGLLSVVMLLALPVLAALYGQWRIIPPGLALALVLVPISTLQTPQWVFYRSMDFLRQRALAATDPVVGFAATVCLAIAGAGYWSLVLGALAGAAAGGIVTMRARPYRLALHLNRAALRDYFSFSWPLTIAGGSAIVLAQSSLIITNAVLGLAAVGALSLASQIAQYTDGVDGIVTGTLYPAICAVRERTELLFEAFVKSNRLALMWGMPFGVGVALFAPQLVQFVIGERWHPAVHLIEIFGLTSASHQIGFNWTAFYNARATTRPVAVVTVAVTLSFLATAIPLTILDGLDGVGIAVVIMTAVGLAARSFYLVRLFPGFRMLAHIARAIAPTVPAVASTLALRMVAGAPRTLQAAIVELALYCLVTAGATWAFERALLREVAGYFRRPQGELTTPPAFA